MANEHELKVGLAICLTHWRNDPPEEGLSVEETARRAFKMVRDEGKTWFTSCDDTRFQIACGVLLTHYKDTDTARKITKTLEGLRNLSAMMSGVPVNISAALPSEPDEILPLLGWYRDTEGE